METQKLSTKKFAINNGLLLGLISVALGVVLYVMNMHLERTWITNVLGIGITVAVIIYGLNQFKKANGGFMSLGQALKLGVGISLIAGIIGVAFNYVLMNYIEPDMINQIMEIQQDTMLERNPNMTQAQMDTASEMTAKFMTPSMMAAFGLLASLFIGLIISLIAGLIMKRNDPSAS